MVRRCGFDDNRLTSLWVSSAFLAAELLSLARARESNQREHALVAAPLAERAVREGRTGSAHRASLPCCPNRRDPSRHPRAGHAAFRPPFAAALEGFESKSKAKALGPRFRGDDGILVRRAFAS